MNVERLDHINIVTAQLDTTADFYVQLLGLERRDGPPPMHPQEAQWLYDTMGQAVIHLNTPSMARAFDRAFEDCVPTGAIHHIAFKCTGYNAVLERIGSREYRTSRVDSIGLDQIFVSDPNGVLLELNFYAT